METQDDRSSDKEKENHGDKDGHRGEHDDLTDDTPIVVGGGASTYVWILKTAVPALPPGLPPGLPAGTLVPITDPDPQYNDPDFTQGSHFCYDIPVDLGSYKTHDGENQGNPHTIKPDKRRKHRTKFKR